MNKRGRKKGAKPAKMLGKNNQNTKGANHAPTIRTRESVGLKKLSKGLIEDYINIFASYRVDELMKQVESGKMTVIEQMIASVMVKALLTGNHIKLDYILSRVGGVGPVEKTVNVNLTNEPFKGWSTEQLEAEHRRLAELNRAKLIEWQKNGGGQIVEAKVINAIRTNESK